LDEKRNKFAKEEFFKVDGKSLVGESIKKVS
jgi:hypothetical protein